MHRWTTAAEESGSCRPRPRVRGYTGHGFTEPGWLKIGNIGGQRNIGEFKTSMQLSVIQTVFLRDYLFQCTSVLKWAPVEMCKGWLVLYVFKNVLCFPPRTTSVPLLQLLALRFVYLCLRGAGCYKVSLTDSMMKLFCPDGSGLFPEGNDSIHAVQGLTEWSEAYENDVM